MLLLCSCVAGLPAAPATGDEVLGFREAWGWAVVLPVEVGSAGVHEFLVDTGSASTLLEPGLAAELGITATSRTNLVTLAGTRAVTLGHVDLTLGRTRLHGVEVVIADLPAIRSDEPRVRGLLGQSALSRLEYTLDHAHRRLVVHGGRSEAPSPATSQEPSARPVLDARVGCGTASTRFVLDSGIGTPVLFRQGRHAKELELGGTIRATTNAGDALWREGRLSSLCVAGHRTDRLPVVLRSENAPAREEDGLLPSRFFARVRVGIGGALVRVDHW